MNIVISPDFAYREESFGALFYSFAKRDLFLAKSPIVIPLLRLIPLGMDTNEMADELSQRGYARSSVLNTIDTLIHRGVLASIATAPKGEELE
ncbi:MULTISPECIES: mycofactocin biosynthesis chaperone MftB [Acidithrix]|uniref:Uncharacterized protein n=1 Tax=Acidithrix ferrooxidans TaxID=1280514 RepID=A0A0D8HDG1_9ACTN|nr:MULTISPECIES: mycofactocin biosynthesis chaperone MftB [Acidithrix]KJF15968.1 hypothetical protein AXFE_31790 [Acidithrix ferrooxidans]CAG4903270.1 unnamed protein product [Acidithrix sp. C25]